VIDYPGCRMMILMNGDCGSGRVCFCAVHTRTR
jgi:hypothetical protein